MDKSWIYSNLRHTKDYLKGVNSFLAAPTNNILPRFGDDTQSLLPSRPAAARSVINKTAAPTNDILPRSADDTHAGTNESLVPHRHDTHDTTNSPLKKTTTAAKDGPRFSQHDLLGKDVILYTVLRTELPAAKGTVVSIDPNNTVGGQPLGNECCEVIVDVVMKRDAILPRPYGDIKTMASADKMSIAWPYNKIKECRKKGSKKASSTHLKGNAGTVGKSLT